MKTLYDAMPVAAKHLGKLSALAGVAAVLAAGLTGCGGSAAPVTSPKQSGSPVIVGSQPGSLPAAPAQSQDNR